MRDACGSASLCGRLAGDRMAAENYLSSQMGSRSANSETALMLCAEGLRGVAALLLTQSRVCALAALCARSEGHGCTCVRQACSRHVQGSRGCGGRSVRKDGKTALAPAAVADARDAALVLAVRRRQASATQMALLLRGLPAQRHRSASLVEEEPASREAPQQHISRRPRSAVLVATLCPYEKELQQPVAELPM